MKDLTDLKKNLMQMKSLLIQTKYHKMMLRNELLVMKTLKAEVETIVTNLATKNQELKTLRISQQTKLNGWELEKEQFEKRLQELEHFIFKEVEKLCVADTDIQQASKLVYEADERVEYDDCHLDAAVGIVAELKERFQQKQWIPLIILRKRVDIVL